MDTEGTYDGQETRSGRVPRPAGPPAHPPALPGLPPKPSHAPHGPGRLLEDWLRHPRASDGPGVWTYGHVPRAAEEPEVTPTRQLVSGALIALLAGLLLWSLLWNGYLGGFWLWPLYMFTPDSWAGTLPSVVASYVWYALVAATLTIGFGRLGRWPELGRRLLASRAVRAVHALQTAAPVRPEAGAPTTPRAGRSCGVPGWGTRPNGSKGRPGPGG